MWSRRRNEDVLGLDVAMEEVVGVDVIQSRDYLVQDALDAGAVQASVGSGLHQLVEIAVHVLHADMQFLGRRIEEDVESRHEVDVIWQ